MGNRSSRPRPTGQTVPAPEGSVDTSTQPSSQGGSLVLPQDSHYARYPPASQQQQQYYGRYYGPGYSQQQVHYQQQYPVGGQVQMQQYAHGGGGMQYTNGQQYYNNNAPGRYPQQGGNTRPQQQQSQNTTSATRPQPHRPPAQSLTQTATIRNAVNLKKKTLKVIPSDISDKILTIQFDFDASAPCCVMTFVAVKEGTQNGSELVPLKEAQRHSSTKGEDNGSSEKRNATIFAPAIRYEKGLGQTFPGNDISLEAATAHAIDLDVIDEDVLTSLDDGSEGYGLVVRMATITEKGLKEGYTLGDIVPGSALNPWVQSQTTFAALEKDEGEWKVKVLKQKLWVEGISYELQEIYGLTAANTASGRSNADGSEEHLCVICLVNRRDTTALPCRHMCMCHECAEELRKQTNTCPICRNNVESLLHIKLNGKAKETTASA